MERANLAKALRPSSKHFHPDSAPASPWQTIEINK
jgi:hypothetical protein